MGRHPNDDDRVFHLRDLSLDKLLAFTADEALIDRYEVTEERVRLFQGTTVFELPPRQAATFLVGMLRGRSWFIADDEAQARPLAGVTREHPSREAASPPGPSALARPRGVAVERDAVEDEGKGVEETLNALLGFTLEAGLILGYDKREDARRVAIQIPACTSTFTYVDAVAFLFDVVEDELREQRRRAARHA